MSDDTIGLTDALTANTEALRAQFEKSISDAATFKVVREGYGYTDMACGWAWEGYQAGHAAGVAAERERCAQVCDRVALAWDGEEAPDGGCVAKQCADAIREGQGKG